MAGWQYDSRRSGGEAAGAGDEVQGAAGKSTLTEGLVQRKGAAALRRGRDHAGLPLARWPRRGALARGGTRAWLRGHGTGAGREPGARGRQAPDGGRVAL